MHYRPLVATLPNNGCSVHSIWPTIVLQPALQREGNVFIDALPRIRLGRLARCGEEIEVASLVGLRDMRGVQRAVSARVTARRRAPGRAPPGQLRRGYQQLQLAFPDV